jgi:long-chain acyl-CoA synthetase
MIDTSAAAAESKEIDDLVGQTTVPQAFLRSVEQWGDQTALRWKNDDESWGEMTFQDYADKVALAAAGMKAKGVKPGDRVVLMLRNVPEFHWLDMAVYFCGATAISIYNSSSPEQVQYLVDHSGASLGIAEDIGFLERFLKVRDEIPSLQQLGVLRDPDGLAPEDVFQVSELLESEPLDLDEAAEVAKPDDLATLIYTSGTTGPPKGVMITHRNVSWTVECLLRALPMVQEKLPGLRVVSYLPMAHIAERMTSHYQQAYVGHEVTTCPDAGQIGAYAREVKPNVMFGVPRVWEKIYGGVTAALSADPEKKAQFDEGVEAAKPLSLKKAWGTATDDELATLDFFDSVAFGPVRELVGLDQLDIAITGAAPIPAELLAWFRAIGVPLSEIYGMSETTGPMTFAALKIKPGTVGPAVPGCEVALAEDGEIICRGGNIFQGYLNNPEKTAEALDDEGWLHSGDIGVIDDDGYFKIVDRKKELIITAGGKNISPANLEAELKMIPLVGQACAIGDQRPFVSALVVLDPDTAPAWAKGKGIEFGSLADLAANPEVIAEVEAGLADAMAGFNNAERVKKIKVLGDEWLPDSEELTPTSKLKRRGIHAKYAEEIEALYER